MMMEKVEEEIEGVEKDNFANDSRNVTENNNIIETWVRMSQ